MKGQVMSRKETSTDNHMWGINKQKYALEREIRASWNKDMKKPTMVISVLQDVNSIQESCQVSH